MKNSIFIILILSLLITVPTSLCAQEQENGFNSQKLKSSYETQLNQLFKKFSTESQKYENKINKLKVDILVLTEDKTNLQKAVESYKTKTSSLTNKLSLYTGIQKKYMFILSQAQQLQNEVDAVKSKGIQSLKETAKKLLSFTDAYAHSQVALNNKTKENNEYLQQITKLEKSISNLEKTINKLNTNNSLLQKNIIKVDKAYKKEVTINSKLNSSNQNLQHGYDTMAIAYKILNNRKYYLENRLKEINNEKEKEILKYNKILRQSKELQIHIDSLESKLAEKKSDVNFLQSTSETQADKLRKMTNEIIALKKQNQELTDKKTVFKAKNISMTKAVFEYNTVINDLKSNLTEKEKKLKEFDTIKKKSAILTEERNLQNIEISTIKDKRQKLLLDFHTLKTNYEKLLLNNKKNKKIISQQKKELTSVYNRLKNITQ